MPVSRTKASPLQAQVQGFTRRQGAAATAVGALALLMSGLLPLLLAALSVEHRLSASGMGQVATLETLATAVTTGLAGAVLKPRRLKPIGVAASLLLAVVNAATIGTHGVELMAVRTLAGVPEGVMLWIAVSLIARTATPERGASVLFTAMAASQLAFAAVLGLLVLPRSGADGGYLLLAVSGLGGVPAALLLPDALGPLPGGAITGAPSARGWIALFAALAFQASVAGVGVYVIPLATQAGLGVAVARTAVAVALACEVLGAALATVLAGRVSYRQVFLGGGLALFAAWAVYVSRPSAPLFIAATGAVGFCALLMTPFVVPMTIAADPSRRAAVQIGAAQLLGGALGPLLASLVVREGEIHGAVAASAAMLMTSLGIVFGLTRPQRKR